MSLTYSPDAFDDATVATPLWRDAVVGASVAAMAAAAGLGTYYEVGAAPWLSTVAGVLTAAALWGAHRQLSGSKAQPRPTRPAPVRVKPAPASPAQPMAPGAVINGMLPSKPELSTFAPRAAGPSFVPPTPAPSAPPPPAALPPMTQPAPQAPVARAQQPTLPAISEIDPEAQFLHLQGLVRQLAADVSGPRALSPDPDHGAANLRAGPMAVGFEAPLAPAAPRAAQASPPPPQTLSPLGRLASAVAAERFDVLLEPIQAIAEARARHFEISIRFRDADGTALSQDETARVARNTGLATSIDVLKLPRVAKVVQRVQSRGGVPADVLTMLAGSSLSDHHFMEAFAGAFPTGVPGPLVLSFSQADVRSFARVHWGALNALGDMGLRFGLADVSDLDMDFDLLRARQFVFAKLDADVFLNGLPCAGTIVPASDICKHVSSSGLEVVVSGIDDEARMARLASYGVALGQGRLFGGARPVKSDILR